MKTFLLREATVSLHMNRPHHCKFQWSLGLNWSLSLLFNWAIKSLNGLHKPKIELLERMISSTLHYLNWKYPLLCQSHPYLARMQSSWVWFVNMMKIITHNHEMACMNTYRPSMLLLNSQNCCIDVGLVGVHVQSYFKKKLVSFMECACTYKNPNQIHFYFSTSFLYISTCIYMFNFFWVIYLWKQACRWQDSCWYFAG